MRSLTEADTGTSIELNAGEPFEIVLAENVTTGYRWQVAECDAEALELVETQSSHSPRAMGSGGSVTFCFRALRRGTSRLVLEQLRAWENKPASATVELEVLIRG